VPFAGALLLGLAGGVVDTWGLAAVFVLAAACLLVQRTPAGALRGVAVALMLVMTAGLLAHALPGFANPRVLDGVRLSADSLPYTK